MMNDTGSCQLLLAFLTVQPLQEMVQERSGLKTRWFDVLAKLKKQVFEQDVHISWERGSIYFDTVKI